MTDIVCACAVGQLDKEEKWWETYDLMHLDLGMNRIASVPDLVGNLSALETLKLGHNRISCLPSTVVNLAALKQLDVAK